MAYETAASIISDAALELGLVAAAIADPWAATITNQNIIQLRAQLKSLGRELVRRYQWQQLLKTYTYSAAATNAFPADFNRMLDQTSWNRTGMLPVPPVTNQQWAYISAVLTNGTFFYVFRTAADLVAIYPTPSGTFAFEYVSNYWVSSDGIAKDKDGPTAAADYILFDPLLALRGLKLAFLRAKGFDTTTAQREFDEALEMAKGGNAAAPTLSLNRTDEGKLLDLSNAPATGFGFDGGGLF